MDLRNVPEASIALESVPYRRRSFIISSSLSLAAMCNAVRVPPLGSDAILDFREVLEYAGFQLRVEKSAIRVEG